MEEKYLPNAQLLVSKSGLLNNVAIYRKIIGASKMLVMVKANGYGTDHIMVAKTIESEVDYFGVAFLNTAIQLRENGINIPIFVMASSPNDLKKMLDKRLEPVLYSTEMVDAAIALNQPLRVHVEIDAGMNRLGILKEELEYVSRAINNSGLTVVSAFAHMVAPGESVHDEFTLGQVAYFNTCFKLLSATLNAKPFKQLMPTSGVQRFKQYQYDMVRLGIGIVGYDPANELNQKLSTVAILKSTILQVREVKKGVTIGYSRNGSLAMDGKIATIAIGYGDGYLRVFGNGNAEVYINGKRAKTVGNVCMDLLMVDVTHIECKPRDAVELFGKNITIKELAECANTIPYEVLTNISTRVVRMLVD